MAYHLSIGMIEHEPYKVPMLHPHITSHIEHFKCYAYLSAVRYNELSCVVGDNWNTYLFVEYVCDNRHKNIYEKFLVNSRPYIESALPSGETPAERVDRYNDLIKGFNDSRKPHIYP